MPAVNAVNQLEGIDANFIHLDGPRTPLQVGTLMF